MGILVQVFDKDMMIGFLDLRVSDSVSLLPPCKFLCVGIGRFAHDQSEGSSYLTNGFCIFLHTL